MAFTFQQFSIQQEAAAMKVGTDGVLLGAWASHPLPSRALDIGAGTGLIALMLAQRFPALQVDAVEIDETAAAEAAANAAASPFGARLQIHAQSIQHFGRQAEPLVYDLIVSNPPFFTGGVLSEQESRTTVRHTVKLSHHDLLRTVQQLLSPQGHFCVVLPWMEGLRFVELARTYQLYTRGKVEVSGRPEATPNRLLLQLAKADGSCATHRMSIYAAATGDQRSKHFSMLTQAFYLP